MTQSSAWRAQSAGEWRPGRPKRPGREEEGEGTGEGKGEGGGEEGEEVEENVVDDDADDADDDADDASDDGSRARCRRALSASARLRKAVILSDDL